MDIDTLQPGRELDALIAEKVMGHKLVTLECGIYEEVPIPGTDGFVSSGLRYYSTDMTAAWNVIEKMTKQMPNIAVWHEGGWNVVMIHRDYGYRLNAPAKTAPLAICLAALKSVK